MRFNDIGAALVAYGYGCDEACKIAMAIANLVDAGRSTLEIFVKLFDTNTIETPSGEDMVLALQTLETALQKCGYANKKKKI